MPKLSSTLYLLCMAIVLAACGAGSNASPQSNLQSASPTPTTRNARARADATAASGQTATAQSGETAASGQTATAQSGETPARDRAARAGDEPATAEAAPVPERVTIDAKEFAFSRKVIHARTDRPLTVTLRNKGQVIHDWVVKKLDASAVEVIAAGTSQEHGEQGHQEDHGNPAGSESQHGDHQDLALHVATDPGKKGSIVFTPSEAGSYKFFCSVPGHREAGMVGKLIVRE